MSISTLGVYLSPPHCARHLLLPFINLLSVACLLCDSDPAHIALLWCLDGAHQLGLHDFSLMYVNILLGAIL